MVLIAIAAVGEQLSELRFGEEVPCKLATYLLPQLQQPNDVSS